MRKKMFFISLIVIMALGVLPNAAAQDTGTSPEPAHLVLSVTGSGARINRMDWDLNAFAPVFPGASVRASDYIDLSGRTTVMVLCTDLTLLDQRGSEVPRCNTYPNLTAFYYVDDPAWSAPDKAITVVTLPADLANIPAEVNKPNSYNQDELVGGELELVLSGVNTINGLDLSAEAKAFALSSFYRSQDVYFEALGALTALPDLGCTARRPTVSPPEGEDRPLVQSPVTYLRVGELYEMLGQIDDALRNYSCAADLAQAVSDPADTALAYARWANVTNDPVEAIQFYQIAIDNYAGLGAAEQANTLLEICGSRNCTLNQ
jgi:tetratricopeptide (TPR) repeat protein